MTKMHGEQEQNVFSQESTHCGRVFHLPVLALAFWAHTAHAHMSPFFLRAERTRMGLWAGQCGCGLAAVFF